MSLSILLADDHPVVRSGVRMLVESEPDMVVVGEAGDGLAALDLVARHQPRVLVLDLMMPGLNGLETARRVKDCSPSTRIVVLSMHANEAYVTEALRAGAHGFVLKESTAADLIQAIRAVAAGLRYVSAALSDLRVRAHDRRTDPVAADTLLKLSNRERQVLILAADGLTNAAIAQLLDLSPRTVETHRAKGMRKLHLKNTSELIQFALRHRLINLQ